MEFTVTKVVTKVITFIIDVTCLQSVAVIVMNGVPSFPGMIVPVQVIVGLAQVNQALKQTHTGETTERCTPLAALSGLY